MDELIAFVAARRLEEGGDPCTIADRISAAANDHIARHDQARVLAGALGDLRRRDEEREEEPLPDPEETEPYCTTCGEPIGHFIGYEGWHHWRGSGTPEDKTELYDPGHELVVGWR